MTRYEQHQMATLAFFEDFTNADGDCDLDGLDEHPLLELETGTATGDTFEHELLLPRSCCCFDEGDSR